MSISSSHFKGLPGKIERISTKLEIFNSGKNLDGSKMAYFIEDEILDLINESGEVILRTELLKRGLNKGGSRRKYYNNAQTKLKKEQMKSIEKMQKHTM